jgi:small subunit ribosomal protein S1
MNMSTSKESKASDELAAEKASGAAPAGKNSKKKRAPRKKNRSGAKRSPGGTHSRSGQYAEAPRFDVSLLRELAGTTIWESVHDAKVVSIADGQVEVDVLVQGADAVRASVPEAEFDTLIPEAGETVSVRLLAPPTKKDDEETATAKASYRQAMELSALDMIKEAQESKQELSGIIVGEVKGGYSVALGAEKTEGLEGSKWARAFLPKSHSFHPRNAHAAYNMVGTLDRFTVREFEMDRANIVVSRRKRLEAEYLKQIEECWASIEVGSVVQGEVRALVPFGAFVDIGGVDGLLHMSDLTWDRPPPVNQMLDVGDTIRVQVLIADKATNKLKLGLKQLTPNPWADLAAKVEDQEQLEGVVVALSDYGAFVRIDDGVEGLVHMSELSWDRVKHPSQVVQIGDTVQTKVLEVDVENRRLSLSIKATLQNPFEKIGEEWPPGTVIKAKVKTLTDFGAFVQLANNVDGLIHIGEMSWTKRIEHPSEMLTVGDEVEAVVLRIDVARQRVACSMRQATENPWTVWEKNFRSRLRGSYKCSKINEQGAFFTLSDELQGFCNVRDLSPDHIERSSDIIKVGQELELEVKNLDRRRQLVIFSAKSIIEQDTKRAYQEYKDREEQEADARLTLGDAIRDQLGGTGFADQNGADPEVNKNAPGEDGASAPDTNVHPSDS